MRQCWGHLLVRKKLHLFIYLGSCLWHGVSQIRGLSFPVSTTRLCPQSPTSFRYHIRMHQFALIDSDHRIPIAATACRIKSFYQPHSFKTAHLHDNHITIVPKEVNRFGIRTVHNTMICNQNFIGAFACSLPFLWIFVVHLVIGISSSRVRSTAFPQPSHQCNRTGHCGSISEKYCTSHNVV